MNAPVVPPQVLALLAQWVEVRTGIHYSEQDIHLFADKLVSRAADAGFESLLDYYYLLQYDDPDHAELDQLIDVLVVGETYFFRDVEPLETLVTLLAAIPPQAGQRLRVWSAACATGEEPVTLAILLERAGLRHRVDIVATDLSTRALERARRGDYGLRAHRLIEAGLEPWIRVANGRATVEERVRANIDWRRVNLTDAPGVRALGTFDAILCRNVLIYFSGATIQKVATSLLEALRPDGRLLVGTSESLLHLGTTFECEERAGSFFYRRAKS